MITLLDGALLFLNFILTARGNDAILQEGYVAERSEIKEGGPLVMNAFEMITLSQGLNLAALFDRQQVQ